MDIPFYYWIVGAVLVLAVLLVLIRKRFLFLRKIKGFEARQEFWLKVVYYISIELGDVLILINDRIDMIDVVA